MKAIYDYHIHTHHIGCANETMQIPDIIDECSKLGLESIAITDHLNHLAQVEQHRKIKEDLSNCETKLKVHFGVEISCVKNNQPYNEKIKESCGFSFTIAGVHNAYEHGFNQKKLLSAHHRFHMMAMTDPLVDILAHPYRLFESELNLIERLDMSMIPDDWIVELGAASRETGTAIEINGVAIFHNPSYNQAFRESYVSYLQKLAQAGAIFSLGSDSHDISQLATIKTAWDIATILGLSQERLWQPRGNIDEG